MALAAIIISLVSVAITAGALCYMRRADRRAAAADAAARLDRVGSHINEAAALQSASAHDPSATMHLQAVLARLGEAIAAARVELPACKAYAANIEPALRAEAERELERERAAV